MKKVKNILSVMKNLSNVLLSVCLTAIITCYGILSIAEESILNKEYIFSKLQRTNEAEGIYKNYYEQIKEYIEENFKNYVYQSGLDPSVVENIITTEQVERDTNSIITYIYDGSKEVFQIDLTELNTRLKNNILVSLNNKKLSLEEEMSINKFISTIGNCYSSGISNFKTLDKVSSFIIKATAVKDKLDVYLKYLIFVIISILVLINVFETFYEVISYAGIGILVSGLFMLIVNIYINYHIQIDKIVVLNDAFSRILREIIFDSLNYIKYFGIKSIFIGFIVILVGSMFNALKHKEK